MLPSLDRFPYSPIRERPDFTWPGGKRVAVHIALATQPELIMAKPGMGVDEAIQLTQNEMSRTLAWINAKNPDPDSPL